MGCNSDSYSSLSDPTDLSLVGSKILWSTFLRDILRLKQVSLVHHCVIFATYLLHGFPKVSQQLILFYIPVYFLGPHNTLIKRMVVNEIGSLVSVSTMATGVLAHWLWREAGWVWKPGHMGSRKGCGS